MNIYYSSLTRGYSVKRAIEWAEKNKVSYSLIPYRKMKQTDIIKILSMTDSGFEDILSRQGDALAIQKIMNKSLDEIKTIELANFLLENTRFLKNLLLVDDKNLQIGFSEENIREFVPQHIRKIERSRIKENFRTL